MTDDIRAILTAQTYAVVGASRSPEKYGTLVYQTLKAAGKTVFAVNPATERVSGDPCWPELSALPQTPAVAVMVVPPAATERTVADCVRLGISHVWMQPGSESEAAVAACRASGIAVVSGGPCIMVLLRTLRYQPQ